MAVSTTNLNKCYQLLGLNRNASHDEVKSAYRVLARKYHPDLNPHDAQAHQSFITLNQAYQILIDRTVPQPPKSNDVRVTTTRTSQERTVSKPEVQTSTPDLTQQEALLKQQLYHELKSLLQQQQFLKAIVLIEGLAQKFALDPQICQWQGIIYSKFGHKLIERREFDKARIYFKKALKVDPRNQQLWIDVEHGYNRIAKSV